ncbi:MAG TPA: hypothetical protein VL527_18715 [Dongiaceae bacterium]|nr:hypothetical protein [Dongiaceae bacterium]
MKTMKSNLQATLKKWAILWLGTGLITMAGAASTNTGPERIGVYDSRLVAYAHFNSPAMERQRATLIQAARAAQQAGDTNKFESYRAELGAAQDQAHRQVFSTAPVAAALQALAARLPEIQKTNDVTVLISKWDEAALRQHPGAVQVDVTEQLVTALIAPTEKQWKIMRSMAGQKPIPLEECNELIRQGKI